MEGSFAVTIGGVVLEWGGTTGLVARLRDVAVLDTDGLAVVAVRRADFELDPAALLGGEIVPRSVGFLSPRFHVSRSDEAGFTVTADPPESGPPEDAPPERRPEILSADRLFEILSTDTIAQPAAAAALFIDRMAGLARTAGDPRLEIIGIEDAEVTYDGGERVWRVGDLAATLRRGSWSDPVVLTVTGDDETPFSIRAETVVDRSAGERAVTLTVENLRPYRLHVSEMDDGDGRLLDLPISGQGRIVFAEDGAIIGGDGRLTVSAEPVYAGTQTLRREADLALSFDADARALVISPSPFAMGESRGVLSGRVAWPGGGRENVDGIAFDFAMDDLHVALPDVEEPALAVEDMTLAGIVRPGLGELDITDLSFVSAGGSLTLTGSVKRGARSPGFVLEGRAASVEAAALKQVWPPFLARGAREWVVRNVRAGRAEEMVFRSDVAPDALAKAGDGGRLPDDALDLSFDLSGAEFDYLGDLPPVRDAAGTAQMTGNTFTLTQEAGTIALESGETLNLPEARFHVPRIHGRGNKGDVNLVLEGPASGLVRLAGHAPLDEIVRPPFEADAVSGAVRAEIGLNMPLGRGGDRDDIVYDVALAFSDFAAPGLLQGRDFSRGRLDVSLVPGRFALSGNGMVGEAPATIQIEAERPPSQDDLGRYELSLLVDETSGAELGLDISALARGPVRATLRGEGSIDDLEEVDLDLSNARVEFAGIGVLKREGEAARLTFRPERTEAGRVLHDVRLSGADLAAEGTIRLEDDTTQVDFTRFGLSAGDASALTARLSGGRVAVSVEGAAFDARPILRALKGPPVREEDTGIGSLTLDIAVDRMIGLRGEEMHDVSLTLGRAGGVMRDFQASGTFASGGGLAGAMQGGEGARQLVLNASNGGALLRFLDFYSNLQGGRVQLVAGMPGEAGGIIPGRLTISDFRIADDEDLRRLAQSGETARRQDLATASDMPFETADITFRQRGGVIAISEGMLRGPAAGGTFQGAVDREGGAVDITGTYVPAYALNSMFSRIPVLGTLLGGREGEGLLGITFALRGPIGEPVLTVNPMSAIAPGLFRRLFEFRNNGASQTPPQVAR